MKLKKLRIFPTLGLAALATAATASAQWTSAEGDGVVSISHGGSPQVQWQLEPMDAPPLLRSFRPSAFLHPLRTPAGFEWTAARPLDHIHHLGLWWPWKHLEIDGKTHNCWELQHGQGAHRAISAKAIATGADAAEWEFRNEIRLRDGADGGPAATEGVVAVHEMVRMRVARHGADANVIDLEIRHRAADKPVVIGQYRYSGFTWRGPRAWNAKNSTMTTNTGLGHDEANGTEGSWVLVSGPADAGEASVLVMSAAVDLAGTPERLRVWSSRDHGGTPFVNFNPVQRAPLPLDDEHPAVSHRQYRVIAADRKLSAEDAATEWQAWRDAAKK